MRIVFVICAMLSFSVSALPIVTDVAAKQRYPWNGLVDITVTLSGTEEECAAATFPFYATNRTTRAELLVRNVKPAGAVAGAGNTWTRRFVWNATADVGCAKFGEVELTIGSPSIGVQLWENGPYWAECNVGAKQPEECGYYFWWGDAVGCMRNANNDGWISVRDSTSYSFNDCPTYLKYSSQLQSEGYIDTTGNLVAAHDAATTYFGTPWRMPTGDDLGALTKNCTTIWTTRNGVAGRLVTGKGDYASKSIFLPAAGIGYGSNLADFGLSGNYLSGEESPDSRYARYLYFSNSSDLWHRVSNWDSRNAGQSVRPVRGFAQ